MSRFCRTCLKQIKSLTYFSTDQTIPGCMLSIKQQLAACVPEIDLDMTANAFICSACSISLTFIDKFHLKCMQSEERVRRYIGEVTRWISWCDLCEIIAQDIEREKSVSMIESCEISENKAGAISDEYSEFGEKKEYTDDLRNSDDEIEQISETKILGNDETLQIDQVESKTFSSKEINSEVTECFVKLLRLPVNITSAPVIKISERDQPAVRCVVCENVFKSIDLMKEHHCEGITNKPFVSRHLEKSNAFTCNICERSFITLSRLNRHMKSHSTEKPFKCNECSLCFNYAFRLKQHLLVHTGEKSFMGIVDDEKCSIKNECFQDTSEDKQKTKQNYHCPICNESFPRAYHFKRHILIHNGAKRFNCMVCGENFTQKGNLNRHMRRHTGEKPFRCVLCYKRFTTKTSLEYHMKSHTGDKPFKCPKCDARFKVKNSVKHHYMRIHNRQQKKQIDDTNKPFKCDFCGMGFKILTNMKRHMRMHTGEKMFECAICHNRYTTKNSLEYHIRSHTGEKPFECLKCSAKFKQKQFLVKHLRKCSEQYEETSEIRDVPEFVFVSVGNIKEHSKQIPVLESENDNSSCMKTLGVSDKEPHCANTQIKQDITATNVKPFELENLNHDVETNKWTLCTICGKGLSRWNNLKRHMQTHTGEKPFGCTICTNRYTTKSSLEYHMKCHTGEKPFKCLHCEARFKEARGLKKHMRRHGYNYGKGESSSFVFVSTGVNVEKNRYESDVVGECSNDLVKVEPL